MIIRVGFYYYNIILLGGCCCKFFDRNISNVLVLSLQILMNQVFCISFMKPSIDSYFLV